MRYRPLGKSGIQVSEIGFGGWGIGGVTPGATSYGPTDDAVSRQALETAFECGITFYDTANVYGAGKSEQLIGETFQKRRDRVVIASKAGMSAYDAAPDFSATAIHASITGSLTRLRTDYIDLLQLHNPPADQPALDETIRCLETLRAAGTIRAIGISLHSPGDGLVFLGRYDLDAIQVNLNLLDQRAVECGLLTAASGKTGVIGRTPLSFGLLTDVADPNMAFRADDHRSRWPRAQIERWIKSGRDIAGSIATREGQSLAQIALRYCISPAAVSTIVPGILTSHEARTNASTSDLGALAAEELRLIGETYRRTNIFASEPIRPRSFG
ncbi:MAG: aldo/keto reductase [Rhodospirillales bacterium]|nr:aldo/keto reductase [Rhodospirillales bacterium]